MAGHPLRPARDRRLGEPLPHLPANPFWAHPEADIAILSPAGSYAVLAAVSSCCPPLQGSFPDTTHPSATRHQQKQAFAMLPFDLHVLSLPPAFNLSHDQTLHYLNSFEFF